MMFVAVVSIAVGRNVFLVLLLSLRRVDGDVLHLHHAAVAIQGRAVGRTGP